MFFYFTTIIIYLDKNAFEVLGHGDDAKLDKEVSKLETRSLALDLCLGLVLVDVGVLQLEDHQIEQALGYEGHHLITGLQK